MMVQSTIDKIKDTTIMRMMRKMAGVIDDQNAVVENVQEQLDSFNLDEVKARLDTDESSISTNTTDIASLKVDVAANTTQIDTNKKNIESLRDANLIITKDITEIKEKNTEQDTEITNLDNADIATATSAFDNTARKLTITLNPKSGDAITAETIIPASGETGDDYTATAPIAIANKDISLAIDTDTMEITTDGKLKSKASGTDYTAGNGITISDNEIAVDTSVIATTAVTTELASGISTNRNLINGTFDDVNISGSHLVFDKVNGEQKEIEIPSSGGITWTKISSLPSYDEMAIGDMFIINVISDGSTQLNSAFCIVNAKFNSRCSLICTGTLSGAALSQKKYYPYYINIYSSIITITYMASIGVVTGSDATIQISDITSFEGYTNRN